MSCNGVLSNCQSDCGGANSVYPHVKNSSYLVNITQLPFICGDIYSACTTSNVQGAFGICGNATYIMTVQSPGFQSTVQYKVEGVCPFGTSGDRINSQYELRLQLSSCVPPQIFRLGFLAFSDGPVCTKIRTWAMLQITINGQIALYGLSPYQKYDPSKTMTMSLMCITNGNTGGFGGGIYPPTIDVIPL